MASSSAARRFTRARFRDRTEAGQALAAELSAYAGRDDVVVLALPRGGVPVAYEVARALDAPLGVGSLQAFVPARFEQHYFTMRDREELGAALRRLCAFDLVANSADRKGGHCLLDQDDRIWAIDNGLCFHEDLKLRTVIWDFAGEPIPTEVAGAMAGLLEAGIGDRLRELLSGPETVGIVDRAAALLSTGRFPHDPTGRRHPWPLV